jgi:lysozyme
MNISEAGIDAIAQREGERLTAYPDPATGGEPWTIGVGHTGGVEQGDTITQDESRAFLAADLAKAEAAINRGVKVPISQNEFDALCSFTFNVGVANFMTSTLLRLLNIGDHKDAANEFPKWNRAAGKIMAGLVTRRAGERDQFLS